MAFFKSGGSEDGDTWADEMKISESLDQFRENLKRAAQFERA